MILFLLVCVMFGLFFVCLFVYLFLLAWGFGFLWFVGFVIFLRGVGVLILIVAFGACKRKR